MISTLALLAELLFDVVAVAMMVPSMVFLSTTIPMTNGTYGATYEAYNAFGTASGALLFLTGIGTAISVLPWMLLTRCRNMRRRRALAAEPWNGGSSPGASATAAPWPRMRRINRVYFW